MRVDTAVYNDRNLLWTLSIAVLTEQHAGETPSAMFGQPEPFGAVDLSSEVSRAYVLHKVRHQPQPFLHQYWHFQH